MVESLASEATEALTRVVVALLSGMLIGIEREKARATLLSRQRFQRLGPEELVVKEFPGLRTFSLIAVYAALIGYMFSKGLIDGLGFAILAAIFMVIAGVFSVYRLVIARTLGVTTSVVMLIDFLIGLLAGFGFIIMAASIAVLVTFILAIKIPVEKVIGRLEYQELLWALELGVVLAVAGPIVWGIEWNFLGVSLQSLYLFFILVLLSSYIGYIAVRLKGGTGIAYLAFLGGFANSEAALSATLQLIPREDRVKLAHHVTVLANSAMIIRDLIVALGAAYAVAGAALRFSDLALLFLASLLSLVVTPLSWAITISYVRKIPPTIIGNPLRFSTAVKAALVYLAIAFTANMVKESYGGFTALLVVSIAGGFVSSSATILTLFTMGIDYYNASLLAVYSIIAALLNKPIYAYISVADLAVTKKVLLSSIQQAFLASIALLLWLAR